jgi:hypothetical protein
MYQYRTCRIGIPFVDQCAAMKVGWHIQRVGKFRVGKLVGGHDDCAAFAQLNDSEFFLFYRGEEF